jgi:hypothetical protein
MEVAPGVVVGDRFFAWQVVVKNHFGVSVNISGLYSYSLKRRKIVLQCSGEKAARGGIYTGVGERLDEYGYARVPVSAGYGS